MRYGDSVRNYLKFCVFPSVGSGNGDSVLGLPTRQGVTRAFALG